MHYNLSTGNTLPGRGVPGVSTEASNGAPLTMRERMDRSTRPTWDQVIVSLAQKETLSKDSVQKEQIDAYQRQVEARRKERLPDEMSKSKDEKSSKSKSSKKNKRETSKAKSRTTRTVKKESSNGIISGDCDRALMRFVVRANDPHIDDM